MRAFAALFDRNGRPLQQAERDDLGRALGRALGGVQTAVTSSPDAFACALIGEEAGTEQMASEGAKYLVGADTLDAIRVAGPCGADPVPSTEAAFLEGRRIWGDELWSRLDGGFGVVLLEPGRHVLHAARDPIGERRVFFQELGELVLIADRIETILNWHGGKASLAPTQLTRYLGLESLSPGSTFFRGIHEIEPGCAAEFSASGRRDYRFWRPPSDGEFDSQPDGAHAERFLSLLRRLTARFLDRPEELGIMLSGGIDSTSIAVLAARGTRGAAGRPAACSWTFDELRSCDERTWIRETLAAETFDVVEVNGDRCWPLADLDLFSNLPGTPEENPYRVLKSALYSAASQAGRRLLLSGGAADIFYRGGTLYLRDLLRDGRWLTAARCFAKHIGENGPRSAAGAAARVIRPSGRRKSRRPPPAWLTGYARARWLEEFALPPALDRGARDVVSYLARESRGLSIENMLAERHGVRLASPYLSREWIEFMLSLPAHQVFRPGTGKYVARAAMRGVVPEPIRRRQEPTLLSPLFNRGVFERETGVAGDLLHGGRPVWQEFVEASFLTSIGPKSPPAHKALLWCCLSLELWRRKHGWEVA